MGCLAVALGPVDDVEMLRGGVAGSGKRKLKMDIHFGGLAGNEMGALVHDSEESNYYTGVGGWYGEVEL